MLKSIWNFLRLQICCYKKYDSFVEYGDVQPRWVVSAAGPDAAVATVADIPGSISSFSSLPPPPSPPNMTIVGPRCRRAFLHNEGVKVRYSVPSRGLNANLRDQVLQYHVTKVV